MSDGGRQRRVGAVLSDHSITSIVGTRMSSVLVEPIIESIKAKIIFITVSVLLILCVVVGIILALVYVFVHSASYSETKIISGKDGLLKKTTPTCLFDFIYCSDLDFFLRPWIRFSR